MNNIEMLIKESGKKLTQISKETGIAYPTLSGYNQGIRTPKKDNAKILADYFGVSVPYLLGLDDKPTLVDPGSAKEVMKSFYEIITKGTSIENKITKWTPFGDELAVILSELNQSEQLADYIDFMASKKDFNPVLVKAIKQFVADKEEGLIPFLINKSGGQASPYHYVWEAWENS
ncbi:helix-turn-helix domain-containing protein [Streptococcus mutans]|nr:helix-turn-helix domain-containing protein [Streptococcus mutans]MCB5110515.1 helix-turn-helix domain-containing protein [Streptococcus mutans]MCB5113637.1 helix-turn-helix domain-containing protein [Streptococcus mutans]